LKTTIFTILLLISLYGFSQKQNSNRQNPISSESGLNMGPEINTDNSEYCGRVSQDGKVFSYSRRMPDADFADFFWINAIFIKELRKTQEK